jgi:DNA-binding MarR family transcriptional regulator
MTGREALISQAMKLQMEVSDLMMRKDVECWLTLNLSISQLKSLVYIHCKGRESFGGLARALGVTPSVVTGIIDRLVLQGMVNRAGGQEDRRIQWLTVTDKGNALLNRIKENQFQDISSVLKLMSDEDLTSYVKGFSALVNAVGLYIEAHPKKLRR